MEKVHCSVTTDERERQLEQHGFATFPIAFYRGDMVHHTTIWHWHDELELILNRHGHFAVGVGKTVIELAEGELCFINAGILHNVWKTDRNPSEYNSVVFHPRLIGGLDSIYWVKYVQPLNESNFPPYLLFRSDEKISRLFADLWRIQSEQSPGYENDIRYLLTRLLMHLSDAPKENHRQLPEREQRDIRRMKSMLTFLESHFSEELTLKQIAESASISETECLRCFQRSIGTSPIRFLKEYRLQRAADLLRTTDESVTEIATACGFFDMSYFTRAFRQLYAATPTNYRTAVRS